MKKDLSGIRGSAEAVRRIPVAPLASTASRRGYSRRTSLSCEENFQPRSQTAGPYAAQRLGASFEAPLAPHFSEDFGLSETRSYTGDGIARSLVPLLQSQNTLTF